MPEMKGWPKKDADNILYFEIILMILFLAMNTTIVYCSKLKWQLT